MSVQPVPGGAASCVTPGAPGTLQTYLACVLASVPAVGGYNNAAALTALIAAGYGLNPGSGNPQINGGYGYVTLGGTITILTALGHGQQPNLDPNGPGTGLGQNYVTPTLAQNIQALNDTINQGIAAAATNTKVPLVDVHTLFNDIATANVSDPLAAIALGGVGPGCCSLTFGGGLLSFDGIHPSNTGYALVAQAFMQTINAAYNLGIPFNPATFVKNQHDGTGTIPFHDPYAK
jgi:hypothetical protein